MFRPLPLSMDTGVAVTCSAHVAAVRTHAAAPFPDACTGLAARYKATLHTEGRNNTTDAVKYPAKNPSLMSHSCKLPIPPTPRASPNSCRISAAGRRQHCIASPWSSVSEKPPASGCRVPLVWRLGLSDAGQLALGAAALRDDGGLLAAGELLQLGQVQRDLCV